MPERELNNRQERIVRFIKNFTREKGTAPTFSELAKHFGVTRSAMFQALVVIQRRGYVTWDAGQRRFGANVRVTKWDQSWECEI